MACLHSGMSAEWVQGVAASGAVHQDGGHLPECWTGCSRFTQNRRVWDPVLRSCRTRLRLRLYAAFSDGPELCQYHPSINRNAGILLLVPIFTHAFMCC